MYVRLSIFDSYHDSILQSFYLLSLSSNIWSLSSQLIIKIVGLVLKLVLAELQETSATSL